LPVFTGSNLLTALDGFKHGKLEPYSSCDSDLRNICKALRAFPILNDTERNVFGHAINLLEESEAVCRMRNRDQVSAFENIRQETLEADEQMSIIFKADVSCNLTDGNLLSEINKAAAQAARTTAKLNQEPRQMISWMATTRHELGV
jgi:hypothetical protein